MGEKIFYIILVLMIGGLLMWAVIEDTKHNNKHIEEGYETIGVVQTHTKCGNPKFFEMVRYKDGCEGKIAISATEYFLLNKED